jgi:hypothetical protein
MKKYDIQLFADGTGAATAGADGGVGTSTDNTANIETGNAAGTNDDSQDRKSFDELVKGEYKSDYQKAIEKTLNKRMIRANAQIQEAEIFKNKVLPAMEKFAAKYGINDPNDIDSIVSAIDRDNSFYEDIAMERGVSVEQAKELVQAERIIKQNEIRQRNEAQQAAFRNQYNGWVQEAEALKEFYPDFNFEVESDNAEFRKWLNYGMSVKDAYEFIHRDDLMGSAMNYAYNQSKQDFADTARANANRPIENGTSSQQPSNYHGLTFDKLNQKQIRQLMTAASKGESIDENNFMKFLTDN